jgi:hypothetical protein
MNCSHISGSINQFPLDIGYSQRNTQSYSDYIEVKQCISTNNTDYYMNLDIFIDITHF